MNSELFSWGTRVPVSTALRGKPGLELSKEIQDSLSEVVIRRVLTTGQEEHHRPESSAAKLYFLHLQEPGCRKQESKKQEREKTKPRPS